MIPTAPDLDALHAFLSAPERPEGTLTLDELHGLLFAVAGSPETIPPSVVLSAVFHGRSPEFDTEDQVSTVIGSFMALYNQVNAQVVGRTPRLPPHVRFREEPMDNFDAEAPVAAWARGFERGLQVVQDKWTEWLPEELFDTYSAAILPLTLFASSERAERFRTDFHEDGTSLEQVAEQSVRMFTEAMEAYAHLGRSIHEARFEQETGPARSRAAGTRVRRNDPCPCGSGKKHKRCCGVTLH